MAEKDPRTLLTGGAKEAQLEITGLEHGNLNLFSDQDLKELGDKQKNEDTFEGDQRDPRERKLTEYLQYDPSPS